MPLTCFVPDFNPTTGETRWDKPVEMGLETQNPTLPDNVYLPPGWHMSKTDEGETMYWHDDGVSTSWQVRISINFSRLYLFWISSSLV